MVLAVLMKQEERYKAAAEERMKAALKDKQEEFNELLAQLVSSFPSKQIPFYWLFTATYNPRLAIVFFV